MKKIPAFSFGCLYNQDIFSELVQVNCLESVLSEF
jgi:hypothetical protein